MTNEIVFEGTIHYIKPLHLSLLKMNVLVNDQR